MALVSALPQSSTQQDTPSPATTPNCLPAPPSRADKGWWAVSYWYQHSTGSWDTHARQGDERGMRCILNTGFCRHLLPPPGAPVSPSSKSPTHAFWGRSHSPCGNYPPPQTQKPDPTMVWALSLPQGWAGMQPPLSWPRTGSQWDKDGFTFKSP